MAVLDFLTRSIRYRQVLPLFEEIENKNKRKLKILDAGGASGDFYKILKEKGHKVFVLDYKEGEEVDFILDLEERLPFKEKEFDVVVSLAVVEHLNNWELSLREFKRIARNVIVTTPTRRGKPVLDTLAYFRLVNKEHIDDHKYYLTEDDFYKIGYNYKTFLLGLNSIAWIID